MANAQFPWQDEIQFYAWLGYFYSAFAQSEATILYILQITSKIDDATAKSIFGGTRASVAKDNLIRIAESHGKLRLAKYLQSLFGQHKTINSVRDRLAHFGPYSTGEINRYYVSTERKAHIPARVEVLHVSTSDLRNMILDLGEIETRLIMLFHPGARRVRQRPRWLKDFCERQAHPWCFKYPQPNR